MRRWTVTAAEGAARRGADAAVAGVWIPGRAADVLAAANDVDTYIPSDLATAFASAFTDYRRAVQSIAP